MQPVKLTIYGDFWDSRIYRGRLYLWDMDNDLHVYDWEKFLRAITRGDVYYHFPLTCAFARSDYLYRGDWSLFFKDNEVRSLVEEKFESLNRLELTYDIADLENCLLAKRQNPFKTLHDDSEIYNNQLYASTENGLFHVEVHRPKSSLPFKIKAEKCWDGCATSLSARIGGYLSISAASDGLFELRLPAKYSHDEWEQKEPDQISEKHTVFANWAFTSIYGSSDVGGSYLAGFTWEKREPESIDERPKYIRKYVGEYDSNQIFERQGLSWGLQEKLYLANNGYLDVVRFTQGNLLKGEEESPFERIDRIRFHGWKGQIIGGGVSIFGTIVLCENALVVIRSDGEIFNIISPITRWRVFPRSERYKNQLHVIHDDRLEIYSFNHDCFVNQKEKKSGIKYDSKYIFE